MEDHLVAALLLLLFCGLTDHPEGESCWRRRKRKMTHLFFGRRPDPLQSCPRVCVKGGSLKVILFMFWSHLSTSRSGGFVVGLFSDVSDVKCL